jgi:CO/xanthine dehydrogenase Mo-binding subunit
MARGLQPRGMLDAQQRVRGRLSYTIDLALPGMLHAAVLRSTQPHARIVDIDTTRARALHGVRLVVTGTDLAKRPDIDDLFGPVLRDQPILARDVVRYVGEPVVAVVADDADAAAAAVELIHVTYSELPAVFEPDEALLDGAPVLHLQPIPKSEMFADVIIHNDPGTNVCNRFHIEKGDVDAAFDRADVVYEDVFRSPAVQHVPLETHACVAAWQTDGIVCHSTTQTPFVLRAQLAEIFGLAQSKIRVVVTALGGAYGGKCYPKIEPLTVALAKLARAPVRLHLTRAEEFVTVTKHQMLMRMRTGLLADGTIVARESTGYFNTGAYADIGPRLIMYAGIGTCGPYRIPNLRADTIAVYTNVPPAGAFRGYGISQTGWAHESHLDMIAERMGLDPQELRRRNLLRDGDTFSTGDAVSNTHLGELLSECTDAVGWNTGEASERQGSRVRAKGVSVVAWRSLPLAVSTAGARLNGDGSLQLLTSSVEMGQGVQTALAILASERLSLPIERISVSTVDTDATPYDQQTSASRSTYAMGGAIIEAVGDIAEQLIRLAAARLEVATADVELDAGTVRVRGVPGTAITFEELIRGARLGNLQGNGRHRALGAMDGQNGQALDEGPGHWHQAAGAAHVEVDLETGKLEVLQYHGAVFAGRIVNPVQAELQTQGAIGFGLGQAMFEQMIYDGGQLQNGSLADYMIPSILDLPKKLDLSVVEHRDGGEIHGLGEPSLPPVMPAIANAVYRATGVRIRDLPITPEKILAGLRELEHTEPVQSQAAKPVTQPL